MSSPRAARDSSGHRLLLVTYLAMGALSALGGARPTGLAGIDAALLALGGVAAAACAVRARTVPVYVAAGAAALCQAEPVPLALAGLATLAAFSRRFRPSSTMAGALAGGLTWAATVGAPFEPGAVPLYVPVAALGWVVWSARRHGSRRFRRRFDRVGIAVGAVAVGAAGLGALAVVNARVHVDRGADLVDAGLEAARTGDTEAAVEHLRSARRALGRGESSLGAPWARPAWLVPGVSQNIRVLHAVVEEVRTLALAGIATAEEADVGGLRASGGRVDLAAVAALADPLTDVLAQLRASAARLDGLTGGWLAFPVDDRLVDVQAEVADAATSVELAIEGVRVAPGLLGGEGPRTYLVLFTTPVEARARTGFPGNFAEVTFDGGRFDMARFGRISELNAALPPEGVALDVPEGFLARYGRFEPGSEWRSISFSPDFPTVASVAAQLYPASGGRPIDGVMSVDPTALAAFLSFTGPIAVPGVAEPLDAENAAAFLVRGQYVNLPENPERIDALEILAQTAFDRLSSATLPGPRDMEAVLGPLVERGHLQLHVFDQAGGAFLHQLGLTGQLPPVAGDFVHVSTSNVAMNKIDLFLRRSLDYEVRWDPSTGSLSATATITLTNEAPPAGLPRYLIDNNVGALRPGGVDMPPGWHYVFLTLYTPWQPVAAAIDGEPLPLEVLTELGRNAVSTFVELGPGASRSVRIELEGSLAERRYVLDLVAQPLVVPERASVRVSVAGGGRLAVRGPVEASGGDAQGEFALVEPTRVSARRP